MEFYLSNVHVVLSLFKFVSCRLQGDASSDVAAKLIISPLYLSFPHSLVKRKGEEEEEEGKREKWCAAVCGGLISKCHYR